MNMGPIHATVEMLFFDRTWFWRVKNFGNCSWKPLLRYVDDID